MTTAVRGTLAVRVGAVSGALALLLLGGGALLRLHQYLFNGSLYLDEAALALNILQRTPLELFSPLAYDQAAPAGYLLLEKLLTMAFGGSEYALRLLALGAGLLALIGFWPLARRTVSHTAGALTALALFALSSGLVSYAAAVKQYSGEAAVTVGLYLAAAVALRRGLDRAGVALLAGAGAAAVWLSFPAVFVLAGIGLPLGVGALAAGDRQRTGRLLIVAAAWLASFLAMYFAMGLEHSHTVDAMQFYWSRDGRFAPLPPTSAADLRWYYEAFFGFLQRPTGVILQGVGAFLALTGVWSLWRGDRLWLGLLVTPILLTVLASGFYVYPFHGRVLTFLVPPLLLLVGEGAAALVQLLRPSALAVPALGIGLVLFHPTLYAVNNLAQNKPYEMMPLRDLRGVLSKVQAARAPQDGVYVYYAATLPFEYYAPRLGMGGRIVEGASPGRIGTYSADALQPLFSRDLERLDGLRRVWLVFSNVNETGGVDEGRYLRQLLERTRGAVLTDQIKGHGASAYLYRLPDRPNGA